MKKMFLVAMLSLGTMSVFASPQPMKKQVPQEINACVASKEVEIQGVYIYVSATVACECSKLTACMLAGALLAQY